MQELLWVAETYSKHGLAQQLGIPVLPAARVEQDSAGNITPTFFLVDPSVEATKQQGNTSTTLSFVGNKAGQLLPDASMLVKYLNKKGFAKEGWEGRRACKVTRCSSEEAREAISGGSKHFVVDHVCRKTKEAWSYQLGSISVVQVNTCLYQTCLDSTE